MPGVVAHQTAVPTKHTIKSPQMPAMTVDPLHFAAVDPDLGDVAKEAGGNYIREKPMLSTARQMFAGEAMERFVKEGHGAEQDPEFQQVAPRLCGEVVELEAVAPNLAEAAGPHPGHHDKHGDGQQAVNHQV